MSHRARISFLGPHQSSPPPHTFSALRTQPFPSAKPTLVPQFFLDTLPNPESPSHPCPSKNAGVKTRKSGSPLSSNSKSCQHIACHQFCKLEQKWNSWVFRRVINGNAAFQAKLMRPDCTVVVLSTGCRRLYPALPGAGENRLRNQCSAHQGGKAPVTWGQVLLRLRTAENSHVCALSGLSLQPMLCVVITGPSN